MAVIFTMATILFLIWHVVTPSWRTEIKAITATFATVCFFAAAASYAIMDNPKENDQSDADTADNPSTAQKPAAPVQEAWSWFDQPDGIDILVDNETGCQYIILPSRMAPRSDAAGNHYGCKGTIEPSISEIR